VFTEYFWVSFFDPLYLSCPSAELIVFYLTVQKALWAKKNPQGESVLQIEYQSCIIEVTEASVIFEVPDNLLLQSTKVWAFAC